MAGIFLAAGSTLFGIAMLRTAVTSKPFAWLTVILGLAALVGIGVISIAHDNPNDYAFVILVVVLPFLLGWRVFNLSRASEAFTGSSP